MFTIRFRTTAYRPDALITLRNNVDGWDHDLPGLFEDDAWRFELDETRYPRGLAFKFVLERSYWMLGENFSLSPVAAETYGYAETQVTFPPATEVIVENSSFQQRFFAPNLDENHEYDVIVIGSGVGGGILADQLADVGQDVLLLEAGSLLFATHTANLPRQHQIGMFDKHIWGLYDEYRVINFVNADGSEFAGGQAFNLGGRSIFWGGLIPRMTWWELETWPQAVKWFLEDVGYQRAEDLMYYPAPPSTYQPQVKSLLRGLLPEYDHFDAPIAVRYPNGATGTLGVGLFSTADLIVESKLSSGPAGERGLTVNLNHAVTRLETNDTRVTGVVALDLLAGKQRTYRARKVVIAAGTIESTKIAKLSNLADPNQLVGVGLTDHPIYYTHFSVPRGKPYHRIDAASKTLSRYKQANRGQHPYNVILELGADLNQGRYLDPELIAEHRKRKAEAMLCEIVFLFNAELVAENRLEQPQQGSYLKPRISMRRSPAADGYLAEIAAFKDKIAQALEGEPLLSETNLDLKRADLGGVAHEVGTLRMGSANSGVVDENLKWNGYDNLFVCDLSVFPSSPAANPTLTLAALALRLAEHLAGRA